MNLALAEEDTAGDPVDVSVLEEVGGLGPVGSPADEPDKLLATLEGVDDTSDSVLSIITTRAKLGDLLGVGVGDGGRVMPDALGREASVAEESSVEFMALNQVEKNLRLEIGRGEIAGISEANELIDTLSAASSTRGSSSKVGTRVLVDADQANLEVDLVLIDLLPLLGRDGTPPTIRVLVGDGVYDHNTTVVALARGRVESGQLKSGLRDKDLLKGDAIALETPTSG